MEGRWEGTGRSRGRGTTIRIYHIRKKKQYSIKTKKYGFKFFV